MLVPATMAALAVLICFGGNYLTGQSMMERPLVVGLVTGLLLGDMKVGILMGASLEALFLGNVNIGGVIAAVGFAMLMKLLWTNKLAVFYLLGFVLTAYLKLPAVAVAALGAVICVISSQRDLELDAITRGAISKQTTFDSKESEEEDFFA
ncbi:TPA: PTS sugar transporter subunit IIC [Streptococcus pyogenes]